jgi:hypothetical protein
MDSRGWPEWCRETAANFRKAANKTKGRRSEHLDDLAAHYDTQALDQGSAMAGNKPLIRSQTEQSGKNRP